MTLDEWFLKAKSLDDELKQWIREAPQREAAHQEQLEAIRQHRAQDKEIHHGRRDEQHDEERDSRSNPCSDG